MNVKKIILILVMVLAACSGPTEESVNLPDNEVHGQQVEQQVEVPTETAAPVQATDLPDIEAEGNTVQANVEAAEEWHLVASYQYIGNTTPTDVLYTWEAWFTVAPDGTLKAVDQIGWAEGMAGLNYNDECVEAQPVTIDWNYDLSGRVTEMAQSDVEEIHGQVGEEIVRNGQVKMFEFNFKNPDVFEYTITPFACAPDLDETFLRSLGTYWITTVPVMSPAFRTVPAEAGMFCQPVLSFEEEGLGTLVPCYLLEK